MDKLKSIWEGFSLHFFVEYDDNRFAEETELKKLHLCTQYEMTAMFFLMST